MHHALGWITTTMLGNSSEGDDGDIVRTLLGASLRWL